MRVDPPDGLLSAARAANGPERITHAGSPCMAILQGSDRNLSGVATRAHNLYEGTVQRSKAQPANTQTRKITDRCNRRQWSFRSRPVLYGALSQKRHVTLLSHMQRG